MKLNLPNKLTVARMIMVPFLMVFITFDFGLGVWSRLIAAAFFGLASLRILWTVISQDATAL